MIKLEVIEGVVEDLVVVDADVNYLANAEENSQTAGLVSMLQAAAGSPGAAHSAQAASDAGDPVEGYSMSVAGQSIAGSFWKTTFKNGDLVKVIGIKQNSVFLAIAVADPITRTIWMQPHCDRGTIEQKKYLLKNSMLFVIAIFSISTVFFTNPNMKLWFYLACASLSSVICLIATVGMNPQAQSILSDQPEQLLEAGSLSSQWVSIITNPDVYCRWLHQDKRRSVGNADLGIM